MPPIFKPILTLWICSNIYLSASAQNDFFFDAGENKQLQIPGERLTIPDKYRVSTLNVQALKFFLWSLPSENSVGFRGRNHILTLPMPDGSKAKFSVWESSIMEPGLATRFPEMRTFAGYGVDDPYASIRFDYNPYFGFSAQILTPYGRIYIDPYAKWNERDYISYYHHDNRSATKFTCLTETPVVSRGNIIQSSGPCRGTELRTYRLAVACTGEYAQQVGGGAAGPTHAKILTSVNRVNGVFETEASIRLVLIANNGLVEFLDPATDPYSNSISSVQLNINQSTIDMAVGEASYDIGHLFCTSDNGLAQLEAVCGSGKARGATGQLNPQGDGFDIDYVAHEMGHQLGANHTFNSAGCASPPVAASAYEPGGGTTIMAYAGICTATDNLQPHSDPFFHARSFDEISIFVSGIGSACGTATATGNTLPQITAMNNNGANIPINTPFTLTASATDADGDAITYDWEEWDRGTAGSWTSAANSTTAPLFRSRIPRTSGSRTFPDLRVILAGFPLNAPSEMDGLKGEILPLVARTMKFKLTVRDNRIGGGGIVSGGDGCQPGFTGIFSINAIATPGPFAITSPNGGEVFVGGGAPTITWNVVGTNAAPINATNVRILLSIDGGLTYPIVLTPNTPNDGTETVTLPCLTTTTARIRIEAIDNIFFDISNNNFSIQPGFQFLPASPAISSCPVPASLSINLGSFAGCGFGNNIQLSATGVPAGTSVSFSTNPVLSGNSATVTLNGTNNLTPGSYTITITGTSPGAPDQSINLVYTISSPVNPTVTLQPANQTVCIGDIPGFSVAATEASGYQWQVSTLTSPVFTDVPGANAVNFTEVAATTTMNNNQYRVIISSVCTAPVISNVATLSVISPATILAQPVNTAICESGNTTFSVTGSGSGLLYQWQVSTNGGSTYANINGAIQPVLTLSNVTMAMNNNLYRVLVSNTTCPEPATSEPAFLTVNPRPTVTLTSSPYTRLLPGLATTINATIQPSAAGFNISWFHNAEPVPGLTGTTYTIGVTGLGEYQVSIVNTITGCNNQSAILRILDSASSKLFIYPSPNDGKFTLAFFNSSGGNTQRIVSIFDGRGARIFQQSFAISGPYTLIPVTLKAATRGIYYVVVGDATGKRIAKGSVIVH